MKKKEKQDEPEFPAEKGRFDRRDRELASKNKEKPSERTALEECPLGPIVVADEASQETQEAREEFSPRKKSPSLRDKQGFDEPSSSMWGRGDDQGAAGSESWWSQRERNVGRSGSFSISQAPPTASLRLPLVDRKEPSAFGSAKKRMCQGCQSDRFWKKGICARCGLDVAGRDPWVGRSIAGYMILARAREGDFGTVYQASAPQGGKTVALHLIREPIRKHLREADAILQRLERWADLSHAALAPLRAFGEFQGGLYWVADWLPGILLSDWMRNARHGAPYSVILDLFKQLLDVLQAIHTRGLTHGQLRPNRILLSPQGPRWRLHLFDVGCGPLLWDREVQDSLRPGEAIRAGMYLAPEQMLPDLHPVEHHADLYTCGIFFFQLLTGRPPFRGVRWELLYRQHLYALPPPLRLARPEREFPEPFDVFLERALAKPPQDRFPSARVFWRSLASLPPLDDPPPPPPLRPLPAPLSLPLGPLPAVFFEEHPPEMILPPSPWRAWLFLLLGLGCVFLFLWLVSVSFF